MRIVLCENALGRVAGHHLNLAAGLKAELEGRGVPLAIWSHTASSRSLVAELDARPVFDRTPYEGTVAGPRTRQLRACLRSAWAFRRGLRRGGVRQGDLLLVPTARPPEILGIAASLRAGSRPAAVVLNFMIDDAGPSGPSLAPALYRFGVALLRRRLGPGRLLLTSASASIARSLSALTGTDVAVFPMIKLYPPATPRRSAGTCTIGFLGAPRLDKGELLLAAVVDSCARAHPRCRIAVQLDGDARPDWPENVDVLPETLDRERYFELLNRLDLAVLPYNATRFGGKTSGVFAEAVACGAVTVVPGGTWMAEMVESGRGAGVVFDDFRVPPIVDAVERAVADLPRLQAVACEARDPWRSSQSVSAYVDRLVEELSLTRDS